MSSSEKVTFVAYYRVSTTKQGASGLGLDAQRASVASYLQSIGAPDIYHEYTEVESGKKNDRPLLDKAMRRCMLTGAKLVIAKLDRLSRDIEFIAKLQKSKVDFVCADMPDANSLTIGMMAVLAQYEREMISARTKAGLQAAKDRGQILGNPRLCDFRNTDTTNAVKAKIAKAEEHNRAIAEVIKEFENDAGKFISANELARLLNDAGYTSRRKRPIKRTQIYRAKATHFYING